MNLHILFCPAQSTAPDGSALPTAALALTLDDEQQYRCAGFIQAEIERYSEELEDLSIPDEDESEANESDEPAEDEGPSKPKKNNKKKAKQPAKIEPTGKIEIGHDSVSPVLTQNLSAQRTRARLEREYIFMGVMATFLRAIRAGAIHFRHSATLLAHYGRLGPSFDLCAKVIVDILREEGMYKDNGEMVVVVILQALREVCDLPYLFTRSLIIARSPSCSIWTELRAMWTTQLP